LLLVLGTLPDWGYRNHGYVTVPDRRHRAAHPAAPSFPPGGRTIRHVLVAVWMLSSTAPSAIAQVSVGIGVPGVSIGIDLPVYPELVPVPDYPVYYAPQVDSNYFFYDGMYWVYQRDNWYASSWYNGPWGLVAPDVVPVYVLRVPVGYYRQPPAYFRGWASNSPPRWGEHWGNDWERHRSGWDRWDRGSTPARAPLPVYQRQYSGNRYPSAEQQQALHSQNYRYQPRDPVGQQHEPEHAVQRASTPPQREQPGAPRERTHEQQDIQRSNPPPPSVRQNAPPAPRSQRPPQGGEHVQRSAPTKNAPPQAKGPAIQDQGQRQQPHPHQQLGAGQREQGGEHVQRSAPTRNAPPQAKGPAIQDQGQRQQPHPHQQQGAGQREQQTPRSSQNDSPQGRVASQEPGRGQGQQKDHGNGQEGSK
jgi:hypothetical protein